MELDSGLSELMAVGFSCGRMDGMVVAIIIVLKLGPLVVSGAGVVVDRTILVVIVMMMVVIVVVVVVAGGLFVVVVVVTVVLLANRLMCVWILLGR